MGDDGDTEFGDFIEDEDAPAPTDVAYRQMLREALEEVMTALRPRETRILLLRFGLRDGRTHTLEEVGEKFAIPQAMTPFFPFKPSSFHLLSSAHLSISGCKSVRR